MDTVKGAAALALFASLAAAQPCDVLVYGATPSGIAASLAAARGGRTVVLAAPGAHVGGLMSSGLSITDLRFPTAFGGIAREVFSTIHGYYATKYGADSPQVRDSNGGLWFEPHVAERVFDAMVAREPRLRLVRGQRLRKVEMRGRRVAAVELTSLRLTPAIAIDATYEGDLAAAAGVAMRVGRESRGEFDEPYAGRVFLKNPGMEILPGSTGEGDHRIQAYNYRLCMTDRPDLRAEIVKPAAYNRDEYASLIEAARRGGIRALGDAIRLAPIPNGKYSANNATVPRSLDLPEDNCEYPNASEERRAAIVARYRDYTLGLIWFLQDDPGLPQTLRADASRWGLCNDEFRDNGHVPYELYVREARRMAGSAVFTAHDAFLAPGGERTPLHADSVAVADYHVDSHLVQRPRPGWPQMEGHVYLRPLSKPSQVPYGVMLPKEVDNLLVTGALSATHLGFGVLRMEPVWMALGQAAGVAARLSLEAGTPPADLPVERLQRALLKQGQVITFFHDVPGPDEVWMKLNRPAERSRITTSSAVPEPRYSPGIQYYGARGFLQTYYARPHDPLTRAEAAAWLRRFTEIEGAALPAGLMGAWAESGRDYPSVPVSRGEALAWVSRLKPGRSLALPEPPGHYITREEFCDLLYAASGPHEPPVLPQAVPMEPATTLFPYTSEGATIRLRDGPLVHAYNRRERPPEVKNWHTHYAPTVIVWAASRDNGKTWGTPELLFTSSSGRTASHPSLVRLANGELGASYNLIDAVDLETPAAGSWVKSVKRAVRVFRYSGDEGRTWSPEVVVTPGSGYWTAAHDRLLVLSSGRVIQPLHNILSEEPYKIGVRVAYSDDHGRTWTLAPSVLTVEDVIAGYQGRVKPGGGVYAEASVAERADGTLLLIARTAAGRQYYSESRDGGASWGKPYPSPIASPEAPARMVRMPGSDDLLIIWNSCCVEAAHPLVGRRVTLSSAISKDGGKIWGRTREIVTAAEPIAGMGVNYPSIYFDGETAYVGYFAGVPAGNETFHQEYVLPIPVAWFYGSERKP